MDKNENVAYDYNDGCTVSEIYKLISLNLFQIGTFDLLNKTKTNALPWLEYNFEEEDKATQKNFLDGFHPNLVN